MKMKKYNSIQEVAEHLGNSGSFTPDIEFKSCDEIVATLIELGNTDKVYAFHDDHLGLKDDLSQKFLNTPVSEADEGQFESDVNLVLEQAEKIMALAERELSEDQIDDIREDYISRGLDPSDIEI